MLGSYYETAYNLPIDGLGATDVSEPGTKLTFPEQTLEDILRGVESIPGVVAAVQPIGVFTGWAMQTGDIDFQDVEPGGNLLIYPLSDTTLKLVKQAAFGHEVGWVAILAPQPVTLTEAAAAFKGRPYELFAGEVLYNQADAAESPRPYFLYWGQLRSEPTDKEAGSGAMESAAKMLGGTLVFPIQVPSTGQERPRPGLSAQAVISSARSAPVAAPLAPAAPAVTQAATAPAAGKGVPLWLWGLGALAVGYGGYRVLKRRKG